MSLLLPTVGVTPAPDWANMLNTAITSIDLHDHTSGYGKAVPTAGINIDSDLDFGSFAAKSLKSTTYSSTLPSGVENSSLFVSSADSELYFKDSAGADTKLTGLAGGGAGDIYGDYNDAGVDGGRLYYTNISTIPGGNDYRFGNQDAGNSYPLSTLTASGLKNDANVTAGQEALTITSVADIEMASATDGGITINSGTDADKNIQLSVGNHSAGTIVSNLPPATVTSFFIDGPGMNQTPYFDGTPLDEDASRITLFAYDTGATRRAGIVFNTGMGESESQIWAANSLKVTGSPAPGNALSSLRLGGNPRTQHTRSHPIIVGGRCNAAFIAGEPNPGDEDTYKPAIQLEYNWNRGGNTTSGDTPDGMVIIQGRGENSQNTDDTWGQLKILSSGAASTAGDWPSDLGPTRGSLQLMAMTSWTSYAHAGTLQGNPGVIRAERGELHLVGKPLSPSSGRVSVHSQNDFYASTLKAEGQLHIESTTDTFIDSGGVIDESCEGNYTLRANVGGLNVVGMNFISVNSELNLRPTGAGFLTIETGAVQRLKISSGGDWDVAGDDMDMDFSSYLLRVSGGSALQIDASKNVSTYGNALNIATGTTSASDCGIKIAPSRTGSHGDTYVNFTSEALMAGYNASIIRKANADGDFKIINTGDGEINLGPSAIKLESTADSGVTLEVDNGAGGGIILNTVQSSAIVLKTLNTERLKVRGTGGVECDNITPSDTSDTPTATQPVDSSNAMNAVLARGYVDWDYTDGANGTATVRANHWNVDYIETLVDYPSRVKVWLDDDCDMDSSISVQVDPTGAPGQSLDKDWLHCVRAQWETTKSFLVHMRQMKDTDYTFHNRGYNFSFIVIGKKG
jgi:hypothetical protein